MAEEKKIDLKEAFKSNEDFLAFLKQEASSGEYRKRKSEVEKGPHPTGEMLYDYVLGWLNDEDKDTVMDHIAYCGICGEEILTIIRTEEESEEELLDWASKPPLIERLKRLVSHLSFPAFSFDLAGEVTRTDGQGKETRNYSIGKQIGFGVDIPADGHLVIFHYDEAGKVQLISPHSSKKDTFVQAGIEEKITGTIEGPSGKQFFKAIWTSKKLIDPEKINFDDEFEVETAIENFFDALSELDEDDWREVVHEFEVLEQ